MKFFGMLMMLVFVSINGRDRYLVREDKIDVHFLNADDNPRLWLIYIDELLVTRGMTDFTNIEAILVHLLPTTVPAEQWCKIPTSYMGLYNYNFTNTITTLKNNITQWLPCGALVYQNYISPSNQEDLITIHVTPHLHINVTIVEIHIDSVVVYDATKEHYKRGFDEGSVTKINKIR